MKFSTRLLVASDRILRDTRMKLHVLAFLLSLFVVAPAQRVCYENSYIDTLVCRGLELKQDEELAFDTSLQKLYLDQSVGSITAKTFSSLPQLKEIRIDGSTIEHIENGALCSLPNLERITLYDNKKLPVLTESLLSNCNNITYLSMTNLEVEPNALKAMVNLKELHIHRMNISHLTKDYLAPFKSLKWLEFVKSKIDQIDDGAICTSPQLETLIMHSNLFPSLTGSVFDNCNSVKKFTYVYHDNAKVEKNIFGGFVNVISARLENLNTSHLKKDYVSGLKNAKALAIIKSKISTIDTDAFTDFDKLTTLALRVDEITEFDPDVIAPLPNLNTLDLRGNKLTSIDNIAHPKLNMLKVDSNNISKIDEKVLRENLPKLFDISVGDLREKYEALSSLPNDLYVLSLADSTLTD